MNTKLLLVSLLMALSAISMPVMAQGTPTEVNISDTKQTITVGDNSINFYDEGGPTGSTTPREGEVKRVSEITFVPENPAKKVMVNFTKMDIFLSSLGEKNSQFVKVYSGKEAKKDNLLKSFTRNEKGIVKSIADDGALTIVFENDYATAKPGWEATVSQFTPQQMTVSGFDVKQFSEGTVCADDKGQQILSFNIKASETLNPLTTTSFKFKTNGTQAQIAHATLYSTRMSDAFSSGKKIGEVDVNSDEFEIATEATTLFEGDNWFWLTYDISEMAEDGKKVDAALVSATLSDGAHEVANGNPSGDRTIKNVVEFVQGNNTKKVNNKLTFKTKNANKYSTRYEASTEERTMTFLPIHAGKKIMINFSRFDIVYSKYENIGVRAKFAVYSGRDKSGQLLWKLDNADAAKVGPKKILRSTADDGALTVVFNPETYASAYTGDGFEAEVAEYESKPLAFKEAVVKQLSNDVAAAGATDLDIISFNVKAEGDKGALNLKGITLDLKASKKAISKITVLGKAETEEATSTAKAVATVTEFGANNTLDIQFTEPLALVEGDNWLRVRYDVKDDAEAESKLDAALTALDFGDKKQNIDNGDPEGERIIKHIVVLQKGENKTKTISDGGSVMFYDDGGADGDESKNFDGTITFAPTSQGYGIKLVAKEWHVAGRSKMYIYYGGEKKDKADMEYGRTPGLTELITKSPDGKITVNYKTLSYAGKGFAIEVSSVKLSELAIASVKTESVVGEKSMKGATDLAMMRVDVETAGDYGTIDVKNFTVTATDGAIVKNVKVYATGQEKVFSPMNLFGQTTASPYEVKGNYTMNDRGTYHFWIAYDLSTTANEGDKASAALASITTNIKTETPAANVTATTTIEKGISGTLEVGADKEYKTIQKAVDALKTGIDGPVTISIQPGDYKENVLVPAIAGMSENNTLLITSSTGKSSDVKLHNNQYSLGYTGDKLAREYGVFTFDGATYTTLRGIEVTIDGSAKYPSVVHVRNMSRNVTVEDCYIHAKMSSSISDGITLVNMYSLSEPNKNNDHFTLKGSTLEGGRQGIKLGGTSAVALPKERGGKILNNTFKNNGTHAIYVTKEDDAQIIGNTIINTETDNKDFRAIDITANGQVKIEQNKINLKTKNYSGAISVRVIAADAAAPATIVNNSIINESNNDSSYGLQIGGTETANVNIAHNTVVFRGKAKGSKPVQLSTDLSNIVVTQNIIQNEAGGYVYFLTGKNSPDAIKFLKNNLYTAGESFAIKTGTKYATFNDWKAVSNEADSYNEEVKFLDAEVLEPKEVGHLVNTVLLDYVTKDINNKQRNADHPTMGAYEFSEEVVIPKSVEGYPEVVNITDNSADVKIKADENGKAYILVKKEADAAPTVEEVEKDGISISISKDTEVVQTIKDLTKDETYIAYIVYEGTRGGKSKVEATKPFKVVKPTPIPEPVVTAENITIEAGQPANLTATVTSGTEPYTITWYNGKRQKVETNVVPTECDQYTVEVVDKNGKTASAVCDVIVKGEAVTATLENLYLDNESHWNGSKGNGYFLSGSYKFHNGGQPQYNFYYDCMYSNETATTYSGLQDQWRNIVGKGYDNSENYGISYPQKGTIDVMNKENGDNIRGFYVTNTAWVYDAVKKGDGMSNEPGGFKKGDYFKLIIKGKKADNTESQVEYYLADYRAENEADHYVLDTWQWVDLSSLGEVKSVSFKMEGTKKNNYGLTTPTYFAFDNFNGVRNEKAGAAVAAQGQTIDISSNFTPDGSKATMKYAIVEIVPSTVKAEVSINEATGELSIKGETSEEFEIVVSMTQAGKTQYVRIPVTFATGINVLAEGSNDAVISVQNGEIVVNGAASDYTVEVYSTSGMLVGKANGTANSVVRIPSTAKGLYIVKVVMGNQKITKSVLVK
ncbi:secretion protein [Prevotella intermedia]|uniref:Secretion protein n=1 Tax=Prevotella intermedia TaxID=28131 RepID=A0A2M8TN62_PREIN|nr:DUF4465 domain-containing protein [Prevotella intermedia]OWP33459.1 secretion protein [Prevotella intermedia]PJI25371.1 secretion protein [Prevotella intermedia]